MPYSYLPRINIQMRRPSSAAPCCGMPANPTPFPGQPQALSPTSLGAARFTPHARPEKVLACPTSSQDPGQGRKGASAGAHPPAHSCQCRGPPSRTLGPPGRCQFGHQRTQLGAPAPALGNMPTRKPASALEVRPSSLHTLCTSALPSASPRRRPRAGAAPPQP